MKAFVNKDTCIGCGLCPGICPNVFSMTDEGIALGGPVKEKDLPYAKEAENSCPVGAISLGEEEE